MILIGIDGADPAIIRELHSNGRLNRLSSLIESGSFNRMHSTEIPITPAAWTSMLTGKNPGKHGVFGFTEIEEGETKIVSHTNQAETFLDRLSDSYSVGMANIPATFPVKKNGVFELAGFLSPSLETDGVFHPAKIGEILAEEEYELDLTKPYTGTNEDELIEDLERHIDTKTRVFKRLREEYDPDICFFTYMAIDWASHWFWKHMDEDHPDHEKTEYRDTLKELYVRLDSRIDELVREGENVVVVSDHGFTSYERSLNLNPLLLEKDLIVPSSKLGSRLRFLLYKAGFTLERAYKFAKTIGLGHLASKAGQSADKGFLWKLADQLFFGFNDLDWDRTDAYSATDFGPVFITSEERRDEIQDEIERLLLNLEDDGETVVDNVLFRDDIYSGPYTDKAPDIVYHTREWKYHATRFYEFGTDSVFSEPKDNKSGHHHPLGVLIAAGPSFSERDEILETSIYDLAPTLLHAFEASIPSDIDGEVRRELLETERHPKKEEAVEDVTL